MIMNGCSQSASDLTNTALHTRKQFDSTKTQSSQSQSQSFLIRDIQIRRERERERERDVKLLNQLAIIIRRLLFGVHGLARPGSGPPKSCRLYIGTLS